MKSKSLLLVTFTVLNIISPSAQALFGIPGTPSLPVGLDPLDDARRAERDLRCARDRDDANMHQKTIVQVQNEVEIALDQLKLALATEQSNLTQFQADQLVISTQAQLIKEMSETMMNTLRSNAVTEEEFRALYQRFKDPVILQTIEEMKSNPKLKEFGKYLNTIFSYSEKDLRRFLKEDRSKSLTANLVVALGQADITITKLDGLIEGHIQKSTERIATLNVDVANKTQRITDLKNEWNAQEVRKQCRY